MVSDADINEPRCICWPHGHDTVDILVTSTLATHSNRLSKLQVRDSVRYDAHHRHALLSTVVLAHMYTDLARQCTPAQDHSRGEIFESLISCNFSSFCSVGSVDCRVFCVRVW